MVDSTCEEALSAYATNHWPRRMHFASSTSISNKLQKLKIKLITGTGTRYNELQKLKIQTITDPSLIGGMVINFGEYYIDMSTATKIKRISQAIKGEK